MFLFVNLFSFTAEAHPNPNPNSNPNPTLYMIRDQTISCFQCGMPALCTSSACNPAPWPDQMWAAATEYSSDVLREC